MVGSREHGKLEKKMDFSVALGLDPCNSYYSMSKQYM